MSTATLNIASHPFGLRHEPEQVYEIPDLRLQSTDSWQLPGYIVGSRLMDPECRSAEYGHNVTDVEHDNAWALRADLIVVKTQILSADWWIITGVLVEDLAAYPEGERPEIWTCTDCKEPHAMTDKYIPPKVKKTNGKWVEVTVHG